jgi:hypothetical protein
MLRNRFSKFSLKSVFTRKKKFPVPKKDDDMAFLDEFALKVKVLNKFTPKPAHIIHTLSYDARNVVDTNKVSSLHVFDSIDEHLQYSFGKFQSKFPGSVQMVAVTPSPVNLGADLDVANDNEDTEAAIRVYFTKLYFMRLRKAFNDKELDDKILTPALLKSLIDISMRGTASERIAAHMQMYGDEFNQERLQECFYSLFEPEVMACSSLFLLQNPAQLHPHHHKNLPKFSKTYLLDKAELNVKLRCFLAWSGALNLSLCTVCNTVFVSNAVVVSLSLV